MERADIYTAQFDDVSVGGHHRVTVGVEGRDRESDGSIPPRAWFRSEEYTLDVENDGGIAIYVRRR